MTDPVPLHTLLLVCPGLRFGADSVLDSALEGGEHKYLQFSDKRPDLKKMYTKVRQL